MKSKNILILTAACILSFGGFMLLKQQKAGAPSEVTTAKVDSSLRKIASEDEDELVKRINATIFKISNKEEIIPNIRNIQKLSADNPEMLIVKLYAAATTPFLNLEGVIWRLRNIVKTCGVCHITALGVIKDFYYLDYMQGPHIKALRDFLVEPGKNPVQFKDVAEVQDFLRDRVLKDIEAAKKAVESVKEKAPAGFFMELDGYLATGVSADFRSISEKQRFKKVVSGNLNYVLAGLESATGSLLMATSYNLDKLPNFIQEVMKKTALNNLLSRDTKHSTPIEQLSVLADLGTSLGKARFDEAEMSANMSKAMKSFEKSKELQKRALVQSYNETKEDLENSRDYIVSPKMLALNYDDNLKNLDRELKLYQGPTTITSEATGFQYTVDLPAAFKYKQNLQDFLPNSQFVSTVRETDDSTHKVKKWDYNYGRPTSYKDPTFGGLLPNATNANLNETLRSMKLDPVTVGLVKFLPVY